VGLMQLAPGSNTGPAHWHSHEEEHLYVLSGCAVLYLGAEEHALEAGSYVCFPAGQPTAHHLDNPSAEPFVYLIVGERCPDDQVTYPDGSVQPVAAAGVHPAAAGAAVRGARNGRLATTGAD
jgi:uncharacterized cupin superfamily protein